MGPMTTQCREQDSPWRPVPCCLPHLPTGSAHRIALSRLNTQPTLPLRDASPMPSRTRTHTAGPMCWLNLHRKELASSTQEWPRNCVRQPVPRAVPPRTPVPAPGASRRQLPPARQTHERPADGQAASHRGTAYCHLKGGGSSCCRKGGSSWFLVSFDIIPATSEQKLPRLSARHP
jgi:hypothetical protein